MPTKIDWCDAVWNPVWGCSFGCPFCYARKFAKRFGKQVAKANKVSRKRLTEFKPTFLPKNFSRKFSSRERVIFVNSMSDIADWDVAWLFSVFNRIREKFPDKVFLFLTKRPEKLSFIKVLKSVVPQNCWFGVSATTGKELVRRARKLIEVGVPEGTQNIFASFEPMFEGFSARQKKESLSVFRWVVFGSQTNPLKLPDCDELMQATEWFLQNDIPVWHKDNLSGLGIELVRMRPF